MSYLKSKFGAASTSPVVTTVGPPYTTVAGNTGPNATNFGSSSGYQSFRVNTKVTVRRLRWLLTGTGLAGIAGLATSLPGATPTYMKCDDGITDAKANHNSGPAGYFSVDMPGDVTLNPGTTYYLVLEGGASGVWSAVTTGAGSLTNFVSYGYGSLGGAQQTGFVLVMDLQSATYTTTGGSALTPLNYRGAFVAGTAYAINDTVINGGVLYRANSVVSAPATGTAGLTAHAEYTIPASAATHGVVIPAGVSVGDLILIAAVSNTAAYTLPAGWTKVSITGGGAYGCNGQYWTKVAAAGDAGSTVTLTSTNVDNQPCGLVVRAYASGTTVDVAASSSSLTTAVVTPTSYPSRIVSLFFLVAPGGAFGAAPAGVTSVYMGGGTERNVQAGDEQIASGNSTSRTGTSTVGTAGYSSATIALKPSVITGAFIPGQWDVIGVTSSGDATAQHYKGAWQSTTTYAANDIVTRSYGLYVALSGSTGTDPAAVGSGVTPTIVQKAPSVVSNPTFATPSAAGNSVLLVVQGSGTGAPTVPSGFTLLYDTGVDPNTGGRVLYFLRNDGASVTSVTYAGSNPGVSSVNFMALFELVGICSSVGTGLSPSINSGTTTLSIASSGPWLAFLTGVNGNAGQSPAPSGFTEQYSKNVGQYEYLWTGPGSGNLQVTAAAGSTYLFLSAVLLVSASSPVWQKVANTREAIVVSKTAAYTIVDPETVVLANGTFTVTLPVPSQANVGKRYTVKNTGTGTITVAAPSGSSIDGTATITMAVQYSSLDFASDATNYYTV